MHFAAVQNLAPELAKGEAMASLTQLHARKDNFSEEELARRRAKVQFLGKSNGCLRQEHLAHSYLGQFRSGCHGKLRHREGAEGTLEPHLFPRTNQPGEV